MRVYALASSGLLHEAELREILHDEPDWKEVLPVVPIELDERSVSANWM